MKGIEPDISEHNGEVQDSEMEYAYEEEEEPNDEQRPEPKDKNEVSCDENGKDGVVVSFSDEGDEKIKRADTIITFEQWCPENETKVREDTCSVELDKDKSFFDLDVVNVQNNDCYKNHLNTDYDNAYICNFKSKRHGVHGNKALATNTTESSNDVKNSKMIKIIAIFFWVLAIACLISAACLFGGTSFGSKTKLKGIIGTYNIDEDKDGDDEEEEPSDVGRTNYDIDVDDE